MLDKTTLIVYNRFTERKVAGRRKGADAGIRPVRFDGRGKPSQSAALTALPEGEPGRGRSSDRPGGFGDGGVRFFVLRTQNDSHGMSFRMK